MWLVNISLEFRAASGQAGMWRKRAEPLLKKTASFRGSMARAAGRWMLATGLQDPGQRSFINVASQARDGVRRMRVCFPVYMCLGTGDQKQGRCP